MTPEIAKKITQEAYGEIKEKEKVHFIQSNPKPHNGECSPEIETFLKSLENKDVLEDIARQNAKLVASMLKDGDGQ